MLFNSLTFCLFFPIVIFLYYALPSKFQWRFLLVASLAFYGAWRLDFLLLFLFSIVLNYFFAIQIDKHKGNEVKKKRYLWVSVATNLGLLFFFKYFNFVSTNIMYWAFQLHLTDSPNPAFDNIILPIGISFYTFQLMAYTIDVYRGVTPVEKNLGYFTLFISFFPQLVAGPIERSNDLLPQCKVYHKFSYDNIKYGLILFTWGLFKKLVIADRVALFVNQVYNSPQDFYGYHLILATFFFTVQIYCDFSGYSDMAIGVGYGNWSRKNVRL